MPRIAAPETKSLKYCLSVNLKYFLFWAIQNKLVRLYFTVQLYKIGTLIIEQCFSVHQAMVMLRHLAQVVIYSECCQCFIFVLASGLQVSV